MMIDKLCWLVSTNRIRPKRWSIGRTFVVVHSPDLRSPHRGPEPRFPDRVRVGDIIDHLKEG